MFKIKNLIYAALFSAAALLMTREPTTTFAEVKNKKKNACTAGIDFLYSLGQVRSHDGKSGGNIALSIFSSEYPEMPRVPRRDLAAPGVCARITRIGINLAKKKSRERIDLSPLASFPGLVALAIGGDDLTNDNVMPLARLNKLEDLSLGGKRLDDRALRILRPLTQLRSLSLVAMNVRGHGLADIGAPSKLLKLKFPYTPVNDTALLHAGKLRNLRTLDISGTRISDAGMMHLSRLRKLRRLDISNTRISDAGLVHLSRLRNLRRLEMLHTRIRGKGMVHLTQLPALKEVFIFGTDLNHIGFKHLGNIPALTRIELNGGQINDRILRVLIHSPAWKRALFLHTGLAESGHYSGGVSYALHLYSKSTGQNIVILGPTRTTSRGLVYLSKLNVVGLWLSNRMTDRDIAQTAHLFRNLRKLTLSRRNTAAVLPYLLRMPRLKTVDTGCSSVTNRDTARIAPKLPHVEFTRSCMIQERFRWEPVKKFPGR